MKTVTLGTPTITVSSNGLITAKVTHSSAGYVASGTKTKTLQLSSSQDSDFIASNIKKGITIFGITGTYEGSSQDSNIPNIPDVGYIVDLFGYTWLVCHDDGTKKYLIARDIVNNVQWNYTSTTTGGYASSNIKDECTSFATRLGVNSLDYVIDTGVGKVFIPTKNQFDGGFSYFNSDDRRIAYDSGSAQYYWTATPSDPDNAWYVDKYGALTDRDGTTRDSIGFRPCICIDTTLYNS